MPLPVLPASTALGLGELHLIYKRTNIVDEAPLNDVVLLPFKTRTGINQSVQVRINIVRGFLYEYTHETYLDSSLFQFSGDCFREKSIELCRRISRWQDRSRISRHVRFASAM